MRPKFDQGPVVPAAVYVFQRHDRRRFKLGWSVDPVVRAQQLPEFKAGMLDLPQSLALWLPHPMRAFQVERSLHDGLAPYRVPPGHDGDGHTEWFAQSSLVSALRLLGQMPSGTRHGGTLPLRRLLDPAPASGSTHAEATADPGGAGESSPQEVWWAVEALWLRLAACLPIRVEREGARIRLVVGRFKSAISGTAGALRSQVYDPQTYTWRHDGRIGAFVEVIDYRGEDLVCAMTPAKVMNRWPKGRELAWQVHSLLGILSR
jgi:T5orf172 domain